MISALKYGDHNIMATLQQLRTWINCNKSSTYREASIGLLKYVSTDVTLQPSAKNK